MNINNTELSKRVYDESLFASNEEKLAYLIMKQRFVNLCTFIEKQKQKYRMNIEDVAELKELWFLYNDLKELNFIGTDIYSNALFIRHKIPFLYRSVGKDSDTKRVLEGKTNSDEIGSTLIKECLEQIKSGGQGKLFSYSKCFGKMLIKYANIVYGSEETTIEIRKNSWINAICEDDNNYSIQKYIRKKSGLNRDVDIPLFSIDMSNARENKVANLKLWINTYLGEQSYIKRYNDIYDPIGDAEVITNFTGDLKDGAENYIMCDRECRYTLDKSEFCYLIYKYALEYATKNEITFFDRFIKDSIETIPNHETNAYYILYNGIVNDNINSPAVTEILKNIDWENEKKYMTRVKAEKSDSIEKIPMIEVYKESNAENISRIWKDIVFEALRGKYACINCEKLACWRI